jgi:UDP-N-acetylmuramate dehydrogenase
VYKRQDRGWGGLENLSLIPGCVGAAPVQNIGAYGSEAKDTIVKVEFVELAGGAVKSLKGDECKFGYRDSIFKNELKGKVAITFVTFSLSKVPVVNSSYADLTRALESIAQPTIKDVRNIVIDIRRTKLPDPAVVGNVGSFFKNPVIQEELALSIQKDNPSLKIFPAAKGFCKVPAAWLIDNCGFKGKRFGNVGVHENQPLVLLAYEGAKGEELLALAHEIQQAVKERFNIEIEPEVNIV